MEDTNEPEFPDFTKPNPSKPNTADKLINQTMRDLGITKYSELAEQLQVAGSTIHTWRNRGAVPPLAELAMKGLAAGRKQHHALPTTIVAHVSREQVDAVVTVLKALGVNYTALK